ncbi:MAG: lipocalin-like domain-containing protein, partial [Prevotellaceae bacterium]|nr:lipocalin-like domain-containing protein [Prevotellaceae bacterium]
DSLIISEPYIHNRDSSDIKITEATLLYPYGIYHLKEGFAIESLTNSAMILKSDSVRLAFRKY